MHAQKPLAALVVSFSFLVCASFAGGCGGHVEGEYTGSVSADFACPSNNTTTSYDESTLSMHDDGTRAIAAIYYTDPSDGHRKELLSVLGCSTAQGNLKDGLVTLSTQQCTTTADSDITATLLDGSVSVSGTLATLLLHGKYTQPDYSDGAPANATVTCTFTIHGTFASH